MRMARPVRASVHWLRSAQVEHAAANIAIPPPSAVCEADVECILVRAHERYPTERPRIISDNGQQCIAKDFKEFIRLTA